MKQYDYLIVGAGLFGAVFAHEAENAVLRHRQFQPLQNLLIPKPFFQAGNPQHVHQASSLPSRK